MTEHDLEVVSEEPFLGSTCDCVRDLIPESFLDELREAAGVPTDSEYVPYFIGGEQVLIHEDDYLQLTVRSKFLLCTCGEYGREPVSSDDVKEDLPLYGLWQRIKGWFGGDS